jgi:hypothetical protein
MAGRGKIARLPKDIREQVNRRLEDGEDGERLLAWLNGLPEVVKVLARDFKGVGISPQNLSEWRSRGYVDWLVRQETSAKARDLMEECSLLKEAAGERLTEHLSTVLAGRYAAILAEWNGGMTEEMGSELQALRRMGREIGALRRGDQREAGLKMELERLARERQAEESRREAGGMLAGPKLAMLEMVLAKMGAMGQAGMGG